MKKNIIKQKQKKNKEKPIYLWDVCILPNNQPTIDLGQYYASTSKDAIEMAAVDNGVRSDENWGAVKVQG